MDGRMDRDDGGSLQSFHLLEIGHGFWSDEIQDLAARSYVLAFVSSQLAAGY